MARRTPITCAACGWRHVHVCKEPKAADRCKRCGKGKRQHGGLFGHTFQAAS